MRDSDSPTPDPVDAIDAALSTLRGRRMPRPPWGNPSGGDRGDGPWGRRGAHRGHPGHGSHADGAHHHGGDDHDGSGRRGSRGGPGWPGGPGRFGGLARLRLLEALAAASGPLSVGEIAEAVGVDQPRASRLVQQSVELGLVRREADPEDARRTRVALTDDGSRFARGFRGERKGAVEAALAEFTEAERAELARLLTKLAAAWPVP